MSGSADTDPQIDLIFRDDLEPKRVNAQEVELIGSVFPEILAELLQMKE